jgi:non-heme chloroperoxidase
MAELPERELLEIDKANESGSSPVMFVHGLCLVSISWDRWRAAFEQHGYATIAPGWPDDPDSVEDAQQDPDVFATKRINQITDHYLAAGDVLEAASAVIGYSFGGLIAQKVAGVGASAATVAIDLAPFRGVLPLPVSSLK